MNKEQAIQLAKNYVSSWKQIKFRGDYIEDEVMCLLQVYDYIFGSLIFDLNKFVDDDLVDYLSNVKFMLSFKKELVLFI